MQGPVWVYNKYQIYVKCPYAQDAAGLGFKEVTKCTIS